MKSNEHTQPTTNEIPNPNRLRVTAAFGAGALLAAVAAGGYFATRGGDSAPTPEKERQPGTSAPAVPGETEVTEPTVEFGISAGEVNGDMKLFANKYYKQLNTFMISGATEEAANSTDRLTTPDDDVFVDEFSAPINEEFFNNIFVEGWQNNPELASYVQSLARVAHDTREIRLQTYAGEEGANEPYVRETFIDSVAINPNDTNKVSVLWSERDNRDMNDAERYYDGGFDPNTLTGGSTLTTVVENGQIKISDVEYYSE